MTLLVYNFKVFHHISKSGLTMFFFQVAKREFFTLKEKDSKRVGQDDFVAK